MHEGLRCRLTHGGLQAATITDPAAEQAVREQLSRHSRQLGEWEQRVAAQLKAMMRMQQAEPV